MKCCAEELSLPFGGVSRRQIYADIEHMQNDSGWNVNLKRIRDGHRVYFRYEDPDFSIFKQQLSPDEVNQLRESILMLNRLRGLPNTERLDEFTSRLENEFDVNNRSESVMSFQTNDYLTGLEHLSTLFYAITNKNVVAINYQPFGKSTRRFCIHPYFLKQYNNRWFLFGWESNMQFMPNIALDRIVSIETLKNETYIPNTNVDFNEYFDDVVGVTILNEPVEKVLLKFDKEQFPYVVSKPIHGSQKIKDKDECIIELSVIPNKELISIIASYGNNVEVMAPESLRAKFSEIAKSLFEKYHHL